jgi:hypothetical protein
MGAYGCDEDQIDYWHQRILKRDNTYVIFGGDMVDAIHEKDRRYTHQECADWCFDSQYGSTIIDRQYEYALCKWKPLAEAGKILWMHTGNHEEALWHKFGCTDLTQRWCGELSRLAHEAGQPPVAFAGRTALSSLVVKGGAGHTSSHSVTFYSEHGAKAANTTGRALNIVRELMAVYAADIYLTGHNHKIGTIAERRIGLSRTSKKGEIREHCYDRVGAVCGTFLNSHMSGREGYGERAGYPPLIPGPALIHIKTESGEPPSVRIEASTAGVQQTDSDD